MDRLRCTQSKIIDAGDQRLTEVTRPNVVDGNACGQGIFRVGDPSGERGAASAAG